MYTGSIPVPASNVRLSSPTLAVEQNSTIVGHGGMSFFFLTQVLRPGIIDRQILPGTSNSANYRSH